MTFTSILFYFFSALMILAALGTISARNPVHAVLFLVLTFFNSAALWILLHADFLGIVLILVYVGAVMVLFLFVVMMLDINVSKLREGFVKYLPLGVAAALLMVIELSLVLAGQYFRTLPVHSGTTVSSTMALGQVLYTRYVYPFEIASVVLLVAIVAAISLTMRRRPDAKHQQSTSQLAAAPKTRVKVVKISAERD